jgi:hypothetical protein
MLLAIWLLDRFLKYLQFYFQSVLHKSKTLFFKDFERWAQARSRRLINIARLTNVGPNLINPGPRPNTEPSENRRRQPRGLLFPSVVQRLPPNLPLPTLILPLSRIGSYLFLSFLSEQGQVRSGSPHQSPCECSLFRALFLIFASLFVGSFGIFVSLRLRARVRCISYALLFLSIRRWVELVAGVPPHLCAKNKASSMVEWSRIGPC